MSSLKLHLSHAIYCQRYANGKDIGPHIYCGSCREVLTGIGTDNPKVKALVEAALKTSQYYGEESNEAIHELRTALDDLDKEDKNEKPSIRRL